MSEQQKNYSQLAKFHDDRRYSFNFDDACHKNCLLVIG